LFQEHRVLCFLLAYGTLAEQQQQVTFMQKLQAERRRRLLEYQQRKRLEADNGLYRSVSGGIFHFL